MTKILWLTPSDMVTEQYHGSLDYLNDGSMDIGKIWYDKLAAPMDRFILDIVSRVSPDIVLYISQASGPFVPWPDTFRRIRVSNTKIAHLCLDAYDVGFQEKLELWEKRECFDVSVACDGGAIGPVDLISFHPIDPRPYEPKTPFLGRPIQIGTALGMPYGLRRDVMMKLQAQCGLIFKPREEIYGSYPRYCRFLKSCQIVPDCAFSAGGNDGKGPYSRTLKTRAIEVGLAGATLLELRGCALKKWATEDVDYATYETPDEAVEVARDLMANPDKAQVVAARLSKIVREKMSPRIFYDQIFTACGLSLR